MTGSRKWQPGMIRLRGQADECLGRARAVLERLRPRLKGTMRTLQNQGSRRQWELDMVECLRELDTAMAQYTECSWEEGLEKTKGVREAAECEFTKWREGQVKLTREEDGMARDRLTRAVKEGGNGRTILTGDAERAMQYGRGENRNFLRAQSLFDKAKLLYEQAGDGDGVAQAEQALQVQ